MPPSTKSSSGNKPGYYLNKTHWNTIAETAAVFSRLPPDFILFAEGIPASGSATGQP
jgi:hypothetical protein